MIAIKIIMLVLAVSYGVIGALKERGDLIIIGNIWLVGSIVLRA